MLLSLAEEVLEAWAVECQPRPSTMVTRRSIVRTWFRWLESMRDTHRLEDITVADLGACAAARAKQVASLTIYVESGVVRALFREAWRQGRTDRDVATGFTLGRKPRVRREALTDEERLHLLTHLQGMCGPDGMLARGALGLALCAGLRVGEVAALRLRDVDFEFRSVTVTGKGGRTRTVFVPEPALGWIRECVNACGAAPDVRLFARGPEDRAAVQRIEALTRRVGAASGIARLQMHRLRHTFATWLRARGVPLTHVALLLGHQRIEDTARYDHLPADVRGAVGRLPALDAIERRWPV